MGLSAVLRTVALLVCGIGPAVAQPTGPGASLVGNWLVTVEGEAETRTLMISVEGTNATGALLSARYGITSRGQSAVEASIVGSGDKRQLVIVTQAASRIAADEQADGSFSGTFTHKSGRTVAVKIARVAEAELQALRSAVAMVPVPPDAPKECAGLHGQWSGNWTQTGNVAYLRVAEVRVLAGGGCSVRYSLTSSRTPVPAQDTVELSAGRMIFTCNRRTNGTCVFRREGEVVEGSYSNPAGGKNWITFKPLP